MCTGLFPPSPPLTDNEVLMQMYRWLAPGTCSQGYIIQAVCPTFIPLRVTLGIIDGKVRYRPVDNVSLLFGNKTVEERLERLLGVLPPSQVLSRDLIWMIGDVTAISTKILELRHAHQLSGKAHRPPAPRRRAPFRSQPQSFLPGVA